MRVLITGDAGFIGSALRAEMVEHGHEVAGFDLSRSSDEDVSSGFARALRAATALPDVVVHLAAEVGKLNCELDPRRAINTNVYGTTCVARACAEHEVPLVFCSTSEVYGDRGEWVVDEHGDRGDHDPCSRAFDGEPSGVYALTKRWGEEACETYAPEGLKIIRPTMPYGPGVPPGPGRRALDNLVWQALTDQTMVVHRGAARSWCWIDDVASGMRAVIERGEPGVYNVGRDDDEVLMVRLAHMILGKTSRPDDLLSVVDPPARQTAIKRISCARLRSLGWEPTTSLDEGLDRMIDWMREWLATGSK